jgi:predicted DNA-binding transcriptional regulator AlpA
MKHQPLAVRAQTAAAMPIFVRLSASQERFGVHRSTLYRAAERGEIKIHKRGAMSWVETAEVSAWIMGCKKEMGG